MPRKAKYIYLDRDPKHPYEWRDCERCGKRYLGRVPHSRFCSRVCSGKSTNAHTRPEPTREGHLVCVKCGIEKPQDAFGVLKRSPTGRRARCRTCRAEDWQVAQTPERLAVVRANTRVWYRANRQRSLEYTRYWRATNPDAARAIWQRRKARQRAATVVEFDSELLAGKWAFWGGRCWMCDEDAVEWDHVKAASQGRSPLLGEPTASLSSL